MYDTDDFMKVQSAVSAQFTMMCEHSLFRTTATSVQMQKKYLASFPEGTNPKYIERTEHDCTCCNQFIAGGGNAVAIIDGELVSIWDVEVGGFYQVVMDAMSDFVKSFIIEGPYLHFQPALGNAKNRQFDNPNITWDHFFFSLPEKFVTPTGQSDATINGHLVTTCAVFLRGMRELSLSSVETVMELIDCNDLHRNEQHIEKIKLFLKLKKEFELLETEEAEVLFGWYNTMKYDHNSGERHPLRVKNNVVGTLLGDLTGGMELEHAVYAYEKKTAGDAYQRKTAPVTPRQREAASKRFVELGLEDSAHRRNAVERDVPITEVLFANRRVKVNNNIFDVIDNDLVTKAPVLKNIEEISIDDFLNKVLPNAKDLEIMFDNKHENQLMTLVAPVYPDCKPMFQWDNHLTWDYKGGAAESLMKARVKDAGGETDAVLRYSIQWNDGDNNQNDFDAHVTEPCGNFIDYHKKGVVQQSSAMLDIDIQNPGNKIAVENTRWTDASRMKEGTYLFHVHNYQHNGGMTGFTAEIEYDGQIYSFSYNKNIPNGRRVLVAEVQITKQGFQIMKSLPSSVTPKVVWGTNTQQFHKVSMVMRSPNHWGDNAAGNKHTFFIMEGCNNPEPARGFYNEYLRHELHPDKGVFELLGARMKTEVTDDQLSGLGFSSSRRNSVVVKVTGTYARTLKINF